MILGRELDRPPSALSMIRRHPRQRSETSKPENVLPLHTPRRFQLAKMRLTITPPAVNNLCVVATTMANRNRTRPFRPLGRRIDETYR